jgi:hypothetical protein
MLRTVGAFASGVVVGWVARGAIGSERELLVRTIVLASAVNERVRRVAAEQLEWWQDLFAEARSRIEVKRAESAPDEESQAKVIRVA